jgi:hypothetical protein
LSHTCIGFFEIGSGELFAWSWLQTVILLISASWVARIYRHEPPMPGWKTILFRFNCKGWRSGSSSRASAYLNLARREALNSSPITTKKKEFSSWAWWHILGIPATQEVEAGGFRPSWAKLDPISKTK